MTRPLTIHNQTSHALELKPIELCEDPSSKVAVNGTGIFGNWTKSANSSTSFAPSTLNLGEHAQGFSRQDVNILIEPFKSHSTNISISSNSSTPVVRLTIESKGQRYRIDMLWSKTQSQTFTPLVPDPKHQYIAIFLPETHLSIYSSANLSTWMEALQDNTPISGLSIPGTHNTPTYHKALPSVRCQAVSPKLQLENGIRFFDIRVQPEHATDISKDGLILVHGVFPISLTGTKYLRPLINTALDFLARNPSETLIMSLKREGAGSATDQHLSQILHSHYANDASKWYTEPRIPTLGEARGKIILLRRFLLHPSLQQLHNGRGWGLNAENWAYNTPHDIHGDVCVQDFCEVLEPSSISAKITYSKTHLAAAGATFCPLPGITTDKDNPVPPGPLYLNFLSGSNFWNRACWPGRIAKSVNPAMIRYLCEDHCREEEGMEVGDGGTGVVVCDWVGGGGDWDLVRCIVGMNSRMEVRKNMMVR
ncbi:phosphatidylinositol phospholipase C [Lepidopterella palustris CBS 459.81]|uniref:Phosphatidylinositol phospholipase C n=1 Tax=Lepidopterella palustris CBS 459.81 TaxID=1314670 RepID=A0A8E2JBZ9_9PEZI|nr:phosphatidylinositol phospholipase C [Lepidopterella palustris CBS 459.81]